jgi:hypothetical protein
MKRLRSFAGVLASVSLLLAPPLAAQEKGQWRSASKTASSITGDIGFTDQKIIVNFSAFTIAQIRTLSQSEATAVFDTPSGGAGNLFRTVVPGAKRFLHKNTLCGAEDVQWVATWVSGHTLELAFFSGTDMPVLTSEALANSTTLCGTYTYAR